MAATDLITTTEYQTYLGLPIAADTKIDALITALSLAIEKYCQTQFVIRSTTQSWRLWEVGYGYMPHGCDCYKMRGIWLNSYPSVTITSIVDTNSNSLGTEGIDFVHHPDIGFLELLTAKIPVNSSGNESYWTVTYTAGRFAATANVDANLKLACIMLVNQVTSRPDPSVRSKTVGQLSLTYANGGGVMVDIFEDVQVLLSPYISMSNLFY